MVGDQQIMEQSFKLYTSLLTNLGTYMKDITANYVSSHKY